MVGGHTSSKEIEYGPPAYIDAELANAAVTSSILERALSATACSAGDGRQSQSRSHNLGFQRSGNIAHPLRLYGRLSGWWAEDVGAQELELPLPLFRDRSVGPLVDGLRRNLQQASQSDGIADPIDRLLFGDLIHTVNVSVLTGELQARFLACSVRWLT